MEIVAENWIKNLNLVSHPEGGYYRETFVAKEEISSAALPSRYGADRKHYTSIYFLLTGDQVSHFHRIKSDEIWAFHAGEPLNIHVIDSSGHYRVLRLGLDLDNEEMPQQMVPAGCWFGASLNQASGYSLVGCIVAPGFDFADFQLAERKELIELFPKHRSIIEHLTP